MNPTLIYEEFKLLSCSAGYVLCLADSLDSEAWTLHAIVVPPMAGSATIGAFCGDERVEHLPFSPSGELGEVIRRLHFHNRVRAMSLRPKLRDCGNGARLRWRDLETGRGIGCAYHLPPPGVLLLADTDEIGMLRTTRSSDRLQYAFSGYDDCVKLSALIRHHSSPVARPTRVLDWGVGSGRIARHMQEQEGFALYGTDIDPVNLERLWRAGYARDRFRQTAPGGPIPFEDASFDAVLGISVFTHLDQQLERFYLRELDRILRPGGVAILSVHGLLHFFSRINDGDLFFRWMRSGFLQLGNNHDLQDGFPSSTEQHLYVDVLHSPTYIYSTWGALFPSLDILPGLNAYGHDLVLCRKAA